MEGLSRRSQKQIFISSIVEAVRPLLAEGYTKKSKLWFFACRNALDSKQGLEISESMESFIKSWKSHGQEVWGFFRCVFHQFLIVSAKESNEADGLSGCSIDSLLQALHGACAKAGVHLIEASDVVYMQFSKLEKADLKAEIGKPYRLKAFPRHDFSAKRFDLAENEEGYILNRNIGDIEAFLKGDFLKAIE